MSFPAVLPQPEIYHTMKEKYSSHQKEIILILSLVAYTISYLCRTNFSIAAEAFLNNDIWSGNQISLTNSFYFWAYATGQIIAGFFAIRFSAKKLITTGLIITGAVNLIIGFSASYIRTIILWTVNGFALAMFWPSIIRLISKHYTNKEYEKISVILNLPTTIGYLVSWSALGMISNNTEWNWVFWIPGTIALTFIIPWTTSVREQSQKETRKKKIAKPGIKSAAISAHTLTMAFLVLSAGAIRESMNLWAPSYFSSFKTDLNQNVMPLFTAMIPLITTAGLILAGIGMKKMKKNSENVVIVLEFISLILSLFLCLSGNSFFLSLFLYAVLLAGVYVIGAIITTFIPLTAGENDKSPLLAGIFNFLAYAGAAIGTSFSGYIIRDGNWNSLNLLWVWISIIPIMVTSLYKVYNLMRKHNNE